MDNIFLFGGAVIVTLVLWLLTARLVRKLYLMFREEARSKLRRESPRVENNELPC